MDTPDNKGVPAEWNSRVKKVELRWTSWEPFKSHKWKTNKKCLKSNVQWVQLSLFSTPQCFCWEHCTWTWTLRLYGSSTGFSDSLQKKGFLLIHVAWRAPRAAVQFLFLVIDTAKKLLHASGPSVRRWRSEQNLCFSCVNAKHEWPLGGEGGGANTRPCLP